MEIDDLCQLTEATVSRVERCELYPAGARFVYRGVIDTLHEVRGSAVRKLKVLRVPLAVVMAEGDRSRARLLFPPGVLAVVAVDDPDQHDGDKQDGGPVGRTVAA